MSQEIEASRADRIRSSGVALALAAACSCAVDARAPDVAIGNGGSAAAPDPLAAGGSGNRASVSPGGNGGGPKALACAEGACTDLTAPTADEVSVTVRVIGDGLGHVRWVARDFPEQLCTDACTAAFPAGTQLLVTAVPGLNSGVARWSVQGCLDESCRVTADAPMTIEVTLQLRYNVAFMTSQVYSPTELPRPGLEANEECARVAAAGGVHGSEFVAWLSGEGATPELDDDVTPFSFLDRGGWVRTDGRPVARSLASLLQGEILHPVSLDEQGHPAAPSAWTSTSASGVLERSSNGSVINCADWSSNDAAQRGGIAASNALSIGVEGSSAPCSQSHALLCFGNVFLEDVPVPVAPGRLAFLSATPFTSGGVAAADAICQSDACQAGLAGATACTPGTSADRTFKAYLHTSSAPAWERFDLTGPTWVRVDGVEWLPDAATLGGDAADQHTGLNVRADGSHSELVYVALGRADGTATCQDWTSASDTDQAPLARAGIVTGRGLGTDIARSCATPSKFLYCLEE